MASVRFRIDGRTSRPDADDYPQPLQRLLLLFAFASYFRNDARENVIFYGLNINNTFWLDSGMRRAPFSHRHRSGKRKL